MKSRSRTILEMAERVAVRLDPSRATLDAKGEALIKKMGPAFGANLRLVVRRWRHSRPMAGRPSRFSTPSRRSRRRAGSSWGT